MLKFYCAPWSRASGVFWLLEELGQPYQIEVIDIRAPGGVPESYRAIQPNKKVPAIVHDGTVVTERAAIAMYLAETFPEAALAPRIGDPERAPYLTWLVYADAVMDPCIAAKAQGWSYSSNAFSFGKFEDMIGNVERTLAGRPYAAGNKFTAADTQVASAVYYALDVLKIFPDKTVFRDYLTRMQSRPAFARVAQKNMVPVAR
jgi:glutathione S-transferase